MPGSTRLPNKAVVYQRVDDGDVLAIILPVEGKGLWSTLYGFIALAPDTRTIEGITFYEHGETPGLGGEVDNPSWKALWPGRKAFDEDWEPAIEVIKGLPGRRPRIPIRSTVSPVRPHRSRCVQPGPVLARRERLRPLSRKVCGRRGGAA